MKLYIFYTPSHKVFLNSWLLKSLRDEYDLIIRQGRQECHTGSFMHEGWMKTMLEKANLILQAIRDNWHEVFIVSDVDIQFFGKTQDIIIDFMRGCDFAAQKDAVDGLNRNIAPDMSGHLCAGFFACRGNSKTLALWKDIKDHCLKNPSQNDQQALNYFLNGFKVNQKHNSYGVKWDYLPPRFFGPGTYLGTTLWSPGKILEIPWDILMHHANQTVGIANKIAQLEYVRQVVERRR